MRTTILFTLAACLSGLAAADDYADRAKLVGSWQAVQSGDQSWSFSTQGDTIKVTQTQAGNKIADFQCGTDGKACEVKIGGKKSSVTFYYNGPKLVEIEERGSDVIKRRFTPAAESDGMTLEVMPINPSGNNETVKFKRVNANAVAKQ